MISLQQLASENMNQSKRTVGLAILSVSLLACAAWLAFGRATVQSGEGRLDIPLMCADCGHSLEVDYDGLIQLTSEAIEKGLANPPSQQAPMGFCPKCAKPALYRADEDPQTGQPVLPGYAKSGDRRERPVNRPPR
jgi:hypothetical protein